MSTHRDVDGHWNRSDLCFEYCTRRSCKLFSNYKQSKDWLYSRTVSFIQVEMLMVIGTEVIFVLNIVHEDHANCFQIINKVKTGYIAEL